MTPADFDYENGRFEAAIDTLRKSKHNALPVAVIVEYRDALLQIRRHQTDRLVVVEQIQKLAFLSIETLSQYAPNAPQVATVKLFMFELENNLADYLDGYPVAHISTIITHAKAGLQRYEEPWETW